MMAAQTTALLVFCKPWKLPHDTQTAAICWRWPVRSSELAAGTSTASTTPQSYSCRRSRLWRAGRRCGTCKRGSPCKAELRLDKHGACSTCRHQSTRHTCQPLHLWDLHRSSEAATVSQRMQKPGRRGGAEHLSRMRAAGIPASPRPPPSLTTHHPIQPVLQDNLTWRRASLAGRTIPNHQNKLPTTNKPVSHGNTQPSSKLCSALAPG